MATKEGRKEKGCFGRELSMGIPSYDEAVEKCGLTPEKNKFSWMQSSQSEAMKMVKGRGTSAMLEKMNDTD